MQLRSTLVGVLLLLFAFSSNTAAQTATLTSINPEDFFVCGSGDFEFTLTNGDIPLSDVVLTLEFSTTSNTACGMSFLNANGITPIMPINPLQPLFEIGDLAANETLNFTITAAAPCSVFDCLNNAELFQNKFTLTHSGGSIAIPPSEIYTVETANLIITDVTPTFATVTQGDAFIRTITIRNTRLGPLSEFTFCDDHQGGFCITPNFGQVIQEDSFSLCIELTAADFMSIGDGDGLFEQDEVMVIEEIVEVKACGDTQQSSISEISIGWGCNEAICQEDTKVVGLNFLASTLDPNLFFDPIISVPECFCGSEPLLQGMTVTNLGTGTAFDINLTARQVKPMGGIDLPSFYVDSSGVDIPISVVPGNTEPFPAEDPCEIDPEIWSRVVANFPVIAAGESITFYWETYFCDQDCLGEQNEWAYGYEYSSFCGDDFFVADTIAVVAEGDQLRTRLSVEDGPLTDGITHEFTYEISYDDLADVDGTLTIELEIPCGLTWEVDNNPVLGGMIPTITQDPMDEFNLVTLTYDLPMPEDSVAALFEMSFACADFCTDDLLCQDSVVTSCMGVDSCSFENEVSVTVPMTTSVNRCEPFPKECAPQSCISPIFSQTCEIDSFCITSPPGYVDYHFMAGRSNFGFADNNNDQICESNAPPDLSLINDKRVLPGDTIHTEIIGEVVVDVPGSTFANGTVDFFITGGQTDGQNNDFFRPDAVVPLPATVRIFDNSTSIYYDCEVEADLTETPYFLQYDYSPATLAAAGCGIPADFVLENGDSIIFQTDFRIAKNLNKENDNTPLQVRLNFTPNILIYNEPIGNLSDVFRCGCAKETFEVTGYEINTFPGVFAVPPCDESAFIGGSLFQILLEEGNYFPFECRNLATLTDFKLTLPDGFELIESKLTFLRNQEGGDILNEQPLSPEIIGNEVCFDLPDFQMGGLDEGFLGLFQYRFTADCEISGSNLLQTTATLDLLDQLPEDNDPLDFLVESPALRSLTPNLLVSTPLCDITGFNNQAVLDFDLINFQTVVASQESGTAQNVWIYPVTNANFINNCQIINTETNQQLPQSNGIFQLGDLAALDTLSLRFVCENSSCNTEEVQLNYGWSCDPFTNPINLSCNTEVKNLTFTAPPAQLELTVAGPDSCSDLCDTIPYQTIEVFNAGLGTAYNLEITAQVPTGVTYSSGSTQVEYPCDSGNFIPVSDPNFLPNGDLVWSACNLLPALEDCGLPPVIFTDENCFRLRFLSQSSCDMVINSFFIFSVTGEQNCGEPTNSLADLGENLCINDIEPPYTGTIDIGQTNVNCQNVNSQLVTIQLNAETEFGDCLILETPNGITANCVEFLNPPFPCDVDTSAGNYVITLPTGVPAGNLIALNIETVGFQDLECGDYQMTLQAATQTLAECLAIQDTCSTKVVVASNIATLSVERPIFELTNFNLVASPAGANDLVNYTINVNNSGAAAPPITTVEFYLAGSLVHTQNINSTIQNGENIPLTGDFEIPQNSLCEITATVNPVCACATDTISVGAPIVYETGQQDTICSNEMIEIGLAEQAGFVYQWTAPNDPDCLDFLECTTCPQTTFALENLDKEPKVCDFVLLESDNMGCLIENQVSVTVQPTPSICLGDSPICLGDFANLCASDGVGFNWSPVFSDQQCINVQPLETTTYFVTIVDTEGCTGTDEFTVEVVPLPSTDLPQNYLFCADALPQLDAGFDENYIYNWSPGTPILDNPTLYNPTIDIQMNSTFSVTITDQFGCEISAETDVNFGEAPELNITADLTICLESSVSITADGASSYEWASPVIPSDCQNAACSEILVMPSETTVYTVVGTNSEGCTASITTTVTVVDGTIFTEETIAACAGDQVLIFDNLENEAGDYSETYALPSGCDSTHTITLILNENTTEIINDTICAGESVEFNGTTYSEGGVYELVLENEQECDSTITFNLVENPLPNVSISGEEEIALNDTVTLSANADFTDYTWSTLDGTVIAACDGSPECNLTPQDNTTYILTATNENGCVNTATFTVNVIIQCAPSEVAIPNAFTPNGDSNNDVFAPVFEEKGQEQVVSMRIWNRWGEKVHESGIGGSWDGTFKGQPAAAGVYLYTIELSCLVGEEEATRTGDVTLIR